MRSAGTVTTAMLLAASVFGVLGPASTARATTKEEVAINGTFRVTSIGDWAKINEQYNGEPTVIRPGLSTPRAPHSRNATAR